MGTSDDDQEPRNSCNLICSYIKPKCFEFLRILFFIFLALLFLVGLVEGFILISLLPYPYDYIIFVSILVLVGIASLFGLMALLLWLCTYCIRDFNEFVEKQTSLSQMENANSEQN